MNPNLLTNFFASYRTKNGRHCPPPSLLIIFPQGPQWKTARVQLLNFFSLHLFELPFYYIFFVSILYISKLTPNAAFLRYFSCTYKVSLLHDNYLAIATNYVFVIWYKDNLVIRFRNFCTAYTNYGGPWPAPSFPLLCKVYITS